VEPSDRTYRNQVVRISDLAVTSEILEELVFEGCEIVGPAVLMLLGSTQFRDNRFTDGEASFWSLQTDRAYVGAIGIKDCLFEGCAFRRIGIAADDATIQRFLSS
jgi:hypothetical protein